MKGWEDYFCEIGINVDKIIVVFNGVDLVEYEVKEFCEELCKEYGIFGFIVVFLGIYVNYVGLDFIVDVVCCLFDVNFLLVGVGVCKQWVIDEVVKFCLINVIFYDQVLKLELVCILLVCDVGLYMVFLQLVFDKGMSFNKFYDYMVVGLVVVFNVKVFICDVISDDEVGVCVDFIDLVVGIEWVCDVDEVIMKCWYEWVCEFMVNKYFLQVFVDKLVRVFEKVLYC